MEGVVDKPYLVLQVTPATETGTNRSCDVCVVTMHVRSYCLASFPTILCRPELRLLLRNRAQDREEVCYLRNEW